MTLTRTDGTTVAVRSRGTFDGSARVFDLSVTAPHDYFANGVLVHNY
jgi:intein/homing endonuclease